MGIHRFIGLGVCCVALAALVPGTAWATCVTLTFEGDVTCYDDYCGPGDVYSTYEDSTITLVLDLDDLEYISSLYNGVLYTNMRGEGAVVSVTWTDSSGTVVCDDGVTQLDETYAELQADCTYASHSIASLELSTSQDPATGEFTDITGAIRAEMGGLEDIEAGMYFFGVDYFEILETWEGEGDSDAVWRLGEWFLEVEDLAPLYVSMHRYEAYHLGGIQWRYEFDGALTGFSVEGVGGVVPEPASVTLLGLGLAAMAAVRTRKRR
ncbi:MAG: VPLPA-CTERM sorting domain-containing protein [Candidatus Hydrogenedentes bacterium]|nr:VPLPA-CTERM sorting domain-containing protein [Candidatus Hydrogenedentota bacterium]